MKKIVGILGTVALLTSSIFAADVSAKVNILGDIFNYDSKAKSMSALGIAEGGQGWNPSFQMSVNGDNAGASMKFYDDKGADGSVKSVNYSIWFQPIDWLKVTVGNFSTNLNQETIDYSHTASGIDSNGYALTFTFGGFSADAFFAPGWSNSNFGWNRYINSSVFFSKTGNADAKFAEFYGKLAYAANFGTLNAYINTNQNSVKGAHDFGVGYANTFGSVNFFTNVIMNTPKFKDIGIIRAEVFAKTNIDGFGIATFVVGGYANKSYNEIAKDKLCAGVPNEKAYVGATLKLTYGIGGYTPYVYLKDNNFLAEKFDMEAKIGCTGNVGLMYWDVGVDMYFNDNFKLDVPVSFTVTF